MKPTPEEKKENRIRGKTVLFLLLSLAFLGAIAWYAGPAAVAASLKETTAAHFAAGVCAAAASFFLGALRWCCFARTLGMDLEYREALRAVLVCWPLSAVTPGKAGELLRALLVKERFPPARMAAAIAGEKVTELFLLAMLAVCGWILKVLDAAAGVHYLLMAAALALAWFLLRYSAAFGVKITLRFLFRQPEPHLPLELRIAPLAAGYIVSLVQWFLFFGFIHLSFHWFGASFEFHHTITAYPLAVFFGALPLSLGGLGSREAAMLFLFHDFAPPPTIAAAGALYIAFFHIFRLLITLPFALNWLLKHRKE